jgi:hypothetical protein
LPDPLNVAAWSDTSGLHWHFWFYDIIARDSSS